MKSLKKSLKNSYIKLILLFSIVIVISLGFIGEYMLQKAKLQLNNAVGFLTYEIGNETTNRTNEIYTKNLVNLDYKAENPILRDLELRIQNNNKIYNEISNKKLINLAENNKIIKSKNLEYLIYKKIILNKNQDPYEVIIIKNLSKEKHFFLIISEIFIFGLIITIVISGKFILSFLKEISYELDNLETINEEISLENLKKINKENKFIEFNKIRDSYNKMIERLDEQNKKQIEFIHNSSHELKTPIFIIGSYINLIKRWGGEDKDILKESIDSIDEEIKSMKTLVEKLLFMAKVNDIIIEKKEIELSDLIFNLIFSLKKQYPEAIINLNPQYIIIYSDESLLKLLFRNIIENSIKYGNKKPIDIYFEEDNEKVKVFIKDRGLGMSEKDLEHIYDRFYRGDKSRNKKINGQGLGMSIVSKILKLTKSTIKIKSEINKGTAVEIDFRKG
ncbi:MAG: HAMP domain-containing histidine kinase [Cetobacterium sp.]|nr:HAMP domain-containing histidine kinase [Cetobacterium sp.]